MKINEIEKKLKKIMSIVFTIDESKIDANTSNQNVEAWDSLKHLSLILAIEEEFNIRFTNKETALINDFKTIVDIIQNNHTEDKRSVRVI